MSQKSSKKLRRQEREANKVHELWEDHEGFYMFGDQEMIEIARDEIEKHDRCCCTCGQVRPSEIIII